MIPERPDISIRGEAPEETGPLRYNGLYVHFICTPSGAPVLGEVLKFYPDQTVTGRTFEVDDKAGKFFPEMKDLNPVAKGAYSGRWYYGGSGVVFKLGGLFRKVRYSVAALGDHLLVSRSGGGSVPEEGIRYDFFTVFDVRHQVYDP